MRAPRRATCVNVAGRFDSVIETPTIHRKNGKTRSVKVHPFHGAWSSCSKTLRPSPGLLTIRYAQTAQPDAPAKRQRVTSIRYATTVIRRFPGPKEAAEACGDATLELLADARRLRGNARLAVSGGSTPKLMFLAMSGRAFDWTGIEVFQVDERCVPPDHEQSNYRMIREALPATPVFHRMRGELPPLEAAALYEDETGDTVFDVIQRGMGADGHTASVFPGVPLPESKRGIVGSVWVPVMAQHRITLMPAVLESARVTLCLVTGAEKADALYQVLRGPRDAALWPAQISSPAMIWFIDEAAGAKLT